MVNLNSEAEKALNHQYMKCIFNYLKGRIETDTTLAEAIKKPNKSIKGVIAYIKSEAKKQAQGNVAVIPDDEVYGWAVHYILEDSIDFEKGAKIDRNTDSAETDGPELEDQCNSEDGDTAELGEKRKAAGKTKQEKRRASDTANTDEKPKSIEEQMQEFYAESELFRGL